MGIASLVLGIISVIIASTLVLAPLGAILAVVGLILGIVDTVKKSKAGEKKGISIAGLIICAITFIVLIVESLLILSVGILTYDTIESELDTYNNSSIANNITNIPSNSQNSWQNESIYTDNTNSKVLGTYTREVFSGNTFDYETFYDNAEFKFNKDSTFECTYEGGNTYKGTYEVYNGLNITTKASKISEDSSINYAEGLASDIREVSEAMMSDISSMLNTYLLYLKVNQMVENGVSKDVEIIQPFVIKYDPDTNIGNAVNIYGQTSGTFTLK